MSSSVGCFGFALCFLFGYVASGPSINWHISSIDSLCKIPCSSLVCSIWGAQDCLSKSEISLSIVCILLWSVISSDLFRSSCTKLSFTFYEPVILCRNIMYIIDRHVFDGRIRPYGNIGYAIDAISIAEYFMFSYESTTLANTFRSLNFSIISPIRLI